MARGVPDRGAGGLLGPGRDGPKALSVVADDRRVDHGSGRDRALEPGVDEVLGAATRRGLGQDPAGAADLAVKEAQEEAAQILGLYRPTLYSKMKKHDIKDLRAQQRAAAAPTTTSAS